MSDDTKNDVTGEIEETPSGGETKQNVITYTQEAFDGIIRERVSRAKKTVIDQLLKETGVESYDALKKLAATQKQKQEAEKTDLQKAQEQIAALQAQALEAQVDRDGVLIQMAIANEAVKQGIPQDRINALLRLMDKNAIVIEEGSVKGVDELVKKTIADNPFLVMVAPDEKQTNGTIRTPGTPPTKRQVPTQKRPEPKPEESQRSKFRF